MQIHLSTRHLQLTGAINSFVADKVSHLEALCDEIIAVHVVLVEEEKKSQATTGAFYAKVHIAVPGPDIHAEARDLDLYAAIDKVVAKLARQLRKRKTKRVDKKKQDAQRKSERRKGKASR